MNRNDTSDLSVPEIFNFRQGKERVKARVGDGSWIEREKSVIGNRAERQRHRPERKKRDLVEEYEM